eukprot:m.161977 g.161977  ORF g.161977 m.161977 type:complete len:422 (+) comp16387_c1_seq1:391-1656(+)
MCPLGRVLSSRLLLTAERSLYCTRYLVALRSQASLLSTAQAGHSAARLVIVGIESTFDDSGVALVDGGGNVLSEALYSQRELHVKTGGTVPLVAQALHEQHLPRVLEQALEKASLTMEDVDILALAIGPGLGPCLKAGLDFTKKLSKEYNLPVLPVHHMEAHALMPRLQRDIPFPYMVLLASGGHCMLLLAEGVNRFRRLGNLLDDSPGDAFEKVARAMELQGGGAEVEKIARSGNEKKYELCHPLRHSRSCNFSFSGLRTMAERLIEQKRSQQANHILLPTDASDIAASFQRAAFYHIMVQTHRAILYCKTINSLPTALVVSGGVACNSYLRQKMAWLCQWHGIAAEFPPPALCTDNGLMIAWAALEYFRAGIKPLEDISDLRFRTKWLLGQDEAQIVVNADIRVSKLYDLLSRPPPPTA